MSRLNNTELRAMNHDLRMMMNEKDRHAQRQAKLVAKLQKECSADEVEKPLFSMLRQWRKIEKTINGKKKKS